MNVVGPGASRSAVLVCQGRAVAHGRVAIGRFDDPTALALLGADERRPVEQVRAGAVPEGFGERMVYERLRATAEVVVPRTVVVDDAVRARQHPQVVIVGAGLDGRAWRMPELATVELFEVDHPASQADKRHRSEALGCGAAPRFVSLDLSREQLGPALSAAGHQVAVATTWIWEGVVPYLDADAVEATMHDIASRSAAGSRLILNYQSPALAARVGRVVARQLAHFARQDDPLAREPWRSTWAPGAIADLAGGEGFVVERDTDLLTVASELGLEVQHRRSLASGRVAIANLG